MAVEKAKTHDFAFQMCIRDRVCIVTFEPLHDTTNRAFIFTIALTALLLLLIPIILTFISGFKGDKAEHEEKREKERQAAVASGDLVLETDPIRRRKYLRLPKLLALLVCPGVLLLSFLVLFFTQNAQDYLAVFLLRRLFMALAAASLFAVIPLLMYWANCSGTSLVPVSYTHLDVYKRQKPYLPRESGM